MSGTEHAVAEAAAPKQATAQPASTAKTPNSAFATLGPWLRAETQPALDALAANPIDLPTVLTTLNRFSTDDIVKVFRAASAKKRTELGTRLATEQLPAVDVPRFALAVKMANNPGAAAARASRLHDLIRGGDVQSAYELLNGLAVADQERALNVLDKAHWNTLANGLDKATGVDAPWLGTLLGGVRGAPVTATMTSYTWLNGQDAATGAAWAADQPDDRLTFMLRKLATAGAVRTDRLQAMLTAGQVRRLGPDVAPDQAARVEASLAGLPSDQRAAIRDYLGLPAPAIPEASAEPTSRNFAKEPKEFTKPSPALEQSCQNLFGQTYAELLGTMQDVHAFGVKATVHPQLALVLQRADAIARQQIAATEGRPMESADWGVTGMLGLGGPGRGFHTFGLAVDLNYATMPYLMNEGAGSKREKPLDDRLQLIYHRIAWLMLGRKSTIPAGPWTYDAHAAESQAMRDYFALRNDPAALRARVEGREAAVLKGVFGDLPPDAATLRELIDKDHDQLTAAPEVNPALPLKDGKPQTMDSPFDPKKGHSDPSGGYLSIRKEIVEALKQADPAMRWGGADFGKETGDLMHFDLGAGIAQDPDTKIFARKKKG
ncbi:hypothetical protein HPO96_27255 [Kribbella sandramycini]|uniref:Uncharacterized protein n=1 Tax=Kribbella sandramycini TaxID=60450 RepID=A0A7Y4P176_9ACTN|nr:hypothetical protein [Kribbella sandramycini]MBB6570821.1 hypothetical protein [Kribbella sandramycini]NOL43952.1 hypothetical protein [Kribbella sandramycini]